VQKALVTGANGFIGRALCKRLRIDGWQVRGSVRSSKQLVHLQDGVEAVIVESIGPDTDWTEALIGVDTVVHLAARVHVFNDSAQNPMVTFRKVNVNGTERLARTAASAGARRFFYMSSVKVNGEGRSTPYQEEDTLNPQDPYGISKWEAEQVLHKIADETDLEVVIVRPPLVYGPGVKANFLRLLDMVNRGIPLPLASVYNRRSLIYLDNIVDAALLCLTHPNAAGQTYLVSDGEDVSTPELLRRMGLALGRPARLIPLPLILMHLAGRALGKSAETQRLLSSLTIDCSKIQRELGWRAPYTMAEGLTATARWYLTGGNNYRRTP
jgi:nucleoside-diphosphate-sugar epimerase